MAEITNLLFELGIEVNVTAPMGATPSDIAQMGKAHFNVLLYPETGETAARYCEKEFDQPYTKIVPIGAGATHDFITEVRALSGSTAPLDSQALRQTWWSRSVDSTYLTGKRVFIFGDGTHVKAAARIARDEMGFEVAGLGCYNREYARDIRTIAKEFGVEALITDDYLLVEKTIEALQPEMILGTQMERHIGKRLGIPCAVISAPVHVQDFPARYSPQMGFEGANVIFDTWVHPLVMGLEEHLLTMFREDFEFSDEAGASHHAAHSPRKMVVDTLSEAPVEDIPAPAMTDEPGSLWTAEAERELKKIPFFVRGKVRRNTETYARAHGLALIDSEALYEAKAHYSR
mgnify:CR=1 FL=1